MSDQPSNRIRPRNGQVTFLQAVLLLAVVGLAIQGTLARLDVRAQLAEQAPSKATLTVKTLMVQANRAPEDLVLPGTAKPYIDAPVYARISGYLKHWYPDIGDRVKSNQLLAEIDAPEIDQQLHQSLAEEMTATAAEKLAQHTAARYRELLVTNVVAKQVAEEKAADADGRRSTVEAAHANVQRLRELAGFKSIRAPFDGIITARKIDIGDLINASGASATQLFQIASLDKIRVFVQVPQIYAAVMQPGLEAAVRFAGRPDVVVPSRLVRTANVIDPAARTLLCELDIENPSHALLAGAYIEARFNLAAQTSTVRVPATALIFRTEGVRVASVDPNEKVQLLPITIGRDFGTEVEIVSGLAAGQRVILNPPDSIRENQLVHVATTSKN